MRKEEKWPGITEIRDRIDLALDGQDRVPAAIHALLEKAEELAELGLSDDEEEPEEWVQYIYMALLNHPYDRSPQRAI